MCAGAAPPRNCSMRAPIQHNDEMIACHTRDLLAREWAA